MRVKTYNSQLPVTCSQLGSLVWLGSLATEDIFAPADPVLGDRLSFVYFLCFVSAGVGIEENSN